MGHPRLTKRSLEILHILRSILNYVDMNITLSIDEKLVKEVRKIAIERDTILSGLVRDYLEKLATENAASGRRCREREALERSFAQLRIKVGKRSWRREDLHARA
jgi:hypothetical protein